MRRALPLALCLAFAGCKLPAARPGQPATNTGARAPKTATTGPVSPADTKPVPTPLLAARTNAASTPATSPASVPPPAPAAAPLPPAKGWRPSQFSYMGRVLTVDEKAQTAIVELSPYAVLPASVDGQVYLYARDRDLQPVARLEVTPNLRGLILGVRALEGRPAVGDEVVAFVPEPVVPAQTEPPPTRPSSPRR